MYNCECLYVCCFGGRARRSFCAISCVGTEAHTRSSNAPLCRPASGKTNKWMDGRTDERTDRWCEQANACKRVSLYLSMIYNKRVLEMGSRTRRHAYTICRLYTLLKIHVHSIKRRCRRIRNVRLENSQAPSKQRHMHNRTGIPAGTIEWTRARVQKRQVYSTPQHTYTYMCTYTYLHDPHARRRLHDLTFLHVHFTYVFVYKNEGEKKNIMMLILYMYSSLDTSPAENERFWRYAVPHKHMSNTIIYTLLMVIMPWFALRSFGPPLAGIPSCTTVALHSARNTC